MFKKAEFVLYNIVSINISLLKNRLALKFVEILYLVEHWLDFYFGFIYIKIDYFSLDLSSLLELHHQKNPLPFTFLNLLYNNSQGQLLL